MLGMPGEEEEQPARRSAVGLLLLVRRTLLGCGDGEVRLARS